MFYLQIVFGQKMHSRKLLSRIEGVVVGLWAPNTAELASPSVAEAIAVVGLARAPL